MAQSIRNIVTLLNQALEATFKGGRYYGVAISVEREGKTQPSVNEKSVSFDDDFALTFYHKINGVSISYQKGYGDQNKTINTFSLSAYVFNNEKRSGLKTDEIAMIIQSVFANQNILSVRILPSSVILNTRQIFETEYRGVQYSLSEYMSLLQFNYAVEITFKSGCFDLCPEDFSQCKN